MFYSHSCHFRSLFSFMQKKKHHKETLFLLSDPTQMVSHTFTAGSRHIPTVIVEDCIHEVSAAPICSLATNFRLLMIIEVIKCCLFGRFRFFILMQIHNQAEHKFNAF